MPEYDGISERVQETIDPLYSATMYAKQFDVHLPLFFQPLIRTHLAWICMLAEQSIVPRDHAVVVCKALRELAEKDPDVLRPFVPDHQEVHMHMEKYLVKRIGQEYAGHLILGRTRPEPLARLAIREKLLNTMEANLALRQQLLDTAERNVESVMIGYTHSQPAQATTFGHYLMGVHDPTAEDLQDLEDAYDNVNRCTLGSGALAGTSFPIDRQRVAALLGFDGIIENTLACVGSNDFQVAAANAVVDTMVTISRVSQDLNEWCTFEAQMMLTAQPFSGISSMMPQKYNTSIFEKLRFHTHQAVLTAQSVATLQMKCHYTDASDVLYAMYPVFEVLDQASDLMRLFGSVVETMKLNKERMLQLAARSFCTSTELSSEIFRRTGMPYRTAHGIVANVVNQALAKGVDATGVTVEMVDSAAVKYTGKPLGMTQEEIMACLDPVAFVRSHAVVGGPAPREVLRAIGVRRRELAEARQRLARRREKLEEAQRHLDEAVANVIG